MWYMGFFKKNQASAILPAKGFQESHNIPFSCVPYGHLDIWPRDHQRCSSLLVCKVLLAFHGLWHDRHSWQSLVRKYLPDAWDVLYKSSKKLFCFFWTEQSLMNYNKNLNLMTHINRQTFSALIQVPMERLGLALPKLSRFADKSMKYATIIFFNCQKGRRFGPRTRMVSTRSSADWPKKKKANLYLVNFRKVWKLPTIDQRIQQLFLLFYIFSAHNLQYNTTQRKCWVNVTTICEIRLMPL